MQLQAVSQTLDAALTSPVAVAEGPEHGGGVSAPGHGIRACAQGVRDQWGTFPRTNCVSEGLLFPRDPIRH